MSSVADLRAELAQTFVPDGWNPYHVLVSSPELPALIVPLPLSMTFDRGLTFRRLQFAIALVTGAVFADGQEDALIEHATQVSTAIAQSAPLTHCRQVVVDDVSYSISSVGHQSDILAAEISVTVLAEIT